ncbi:hypothetical protein C0966_00755 [Bacillus methanolicus]|uniref:transglycosylase SLT domain-containing protein n=1 Tax=Bacillus methanolicus TaxID=1471 RepID=UPI0023805E8A|nr:transglycosylase SLT domain-containing protein [Bacillus methanolicus]MDE3837938.1 hypothetical protein [Bacillus methanolicus]
MEQLRELTVDIGFNADSSPLSEITREMSRFTQQTKGASSEVVKMSAATQAMKAVNKGLIDETKALNSQLSRQSDLIRQLARTSGMSATQLAADWADMSKEMKQSMIRNHNDMRKYRKELMSVRHDMRKLGMQMGHYTGSTNDFMKEINKLGKAHKKITDQMINSNLSMRQSLIQTVATMSAMSGQSEKISANYDRMGNAVYLVNKPLLAITSNLERMARQGNAASLALQMLGPNASMKALQDQIRLINQGIMRQQAVVMAASVAWLGFTAIMAHAALGPDPTEIRKQQQELTRIYREEWQKRVDEISHFVGLFEKVSVPKVKGSDLTKALKSQLDAIKIWRTNLQGLIKKGVDEGLIQELQKAGPAAAGQVKALNTMSKPELDKYVALWREKMGLAKQQATDELAKLKQQTDAKIRELQNSLTPLGKSWERFKSTWADALKPFVDLWGQIASKVVDFGTTIGKFVQKLNEISPWITKLAGMFLYLVVTFTLLLSPLAIGIGYFMGLKAAFSAAWVMIKPLVTGLAAMSGTVFLVSALVLGLGVALYLLWTRSETFRNAVINGWNAIKSAAISVWGFIKPYINQAISAVVGFVQEKMAALKTFWDQNGSQILQAAKNVWTPIQAVIVVAAKTIWAVMKFVWPLVLSLIKSVWGNIKGVINGALNVIMGLVKVFSGLFTGDFGKMWEGIKQVFSGAIQFIWNFIQLSMFGRVLGAGKAFVVGFKNVFVALWNGLKSLFVGGVRAVWSFLVKGFTGMRNASNTILTGLKNTALGIWNTLRGGLYGLISRIVGSVRTAWTTAKTNTVNMFNSIKSAITQRFNDIVDAAKALPGKIGSGIKSMAGKALSGVKHLANTLVGGLAQGINGVTGGINWVLDKIGVDKKIPTWTPPRYAKGTNYHPGGLAIVGDGGGPELIRTPSGQIGLSPAKSTLVNLPKGSEVLPHRETQALLKSGLIPAYAKGIGTKLKSVASKAVDTAKNVAGKAWTGAKKAVGKAKDLALDVWSYIDNPGKLMKKVWEQFGVKAPSVAGSFGDIGKGALTMIKDKAISFVKKKLEDIGSFAGGSAAPSQVKAWIIQALKITKTPLSWLPALLLKAQKESTFNPRAINLWDSNAKRGTPSKGLMQVIDPTFRQYKLPGFNDIWNPVHNTIAAIRYIKARYGTVFNTPGIRSMRRGGPYRGYAAGGIATKPQWATLAENGWKEFIIPTQPSMRKRALALLAQANAELGYTPSREKSSTSNTYTPSISGSVGGRTYTVHYAPHVEIKVEGNLDANTTQSLKQEFQKMLDEHYKKLNDLFGSEVVY